MRPFSQQFTARGIIIGVLGCALITASSLYTALKLGALPWPIFFVVLLALFTLRIFARFGKSTNINEANVSATMMSAGAMVAGGIAFTVPGIFMLMPNAEIPFFSLLIAALVGVAFGCVGTALFRRNFIVQSKLPYPIGTGAAETLKASWEGGKNALVLFVSAGIAFVIALIRDRLLLLPQLFLSWVKIPGVVFGIACSPMALAMGYLIGPLAALVWIIGAVIGDFGVVVGGVAAGLWDQAAAAGIKTSLGIGVMIGCGVGVVLKLLVGLVKKPAAKTATPSSDTAEGGKGEERGKTGREDSIDNEQDDERANASVLLKPGWALFAAAALALVLAITNVISPLAAILLVVGIWVAMLMAAQSTGQAGLNPMEVFGIIVLLVIALFVQLGSIEAFMVAAVVTIACGFVGDMMNDFKAGYILNTNPRAQWFAECIGGVVGAVVAAGVMVLLVQAYGTEAFGPDRTFVAVQASAVAAMVGAIPSLEAFLIGLFIGALLYMFNAPVITLGLGIYLPFYLSLTVAVGAAARFVISKLKPSLAKGEKGIVVASGLLAGESIAGVVVAILVVFSA